MRSRVLIVLSVLMLTLLLPGTVGARSSNDAARAQAEDARVLAYWTPERIASAKPRDFVRDSSGKLVPYARPGGGGGGGGGGNVTGASWPSGGKIQERSGRILFSSGGSNWICSGSVVNDGSTSNGYSVILTAGHCVFDGADGWSYNFLYMPNFDADPNYNCTTRQLGCWRASRLSANDGFVPAGFGNGTVDVDYGFALVGLRLAGGGSPGGTELDALYGGYNIRTTAPALTATQWAFGYPAEGKYKGKDLIYCMGPTINDPYGADTTGIACNMNGGSSGGPRLADTSSPADGSGTLSSNNSYGYSGLQYMFGPKFDTTTVAVKDAVISGSSAGAATTCDVGTAPPSC